MHLTPKQLQQGASLASLRHNTVDPVDGVLRKHESG